MSHKKFGPDRFSRFDVYWIQTNKQTDKQTDRQAKFIYRYNIEQDGSARLLAVLRFYISTLKCTRPIDSPCKPYNPILGEFFTCSWQIHGVNLVQLGHFIGRHLIERNFIDRFFFLSFK